MARKSKKNIVNSGGTVDCVLDVKPYYQTAIYARLSKEDNGYEDSDTIQNQIDIIGQYIKSSSNLSLKDTYIDNGYSGVNFDRPEFQRLIYDIESGKINCVVVKDLSRLGRDYISVGEYLYNFFPSINTRFISINDNFDSNINKGVDEIVLSLKNLINASYSKDIAKKITSSLRRKQEKGEYIGGNLYGYIKKNGDKNKIYVDKDVSEVIVEIFKLRGKEKSFDEIAETLNSKNILSPKKYLTNKGCLNKFDDYDNLIWIPSTLSKMTRNEIYIGNMVQGKRKDSIYGKTEYVDKKDWIVVENTHEPIISKELWDRVQEINDRKASACKKIKHKENILKGLLFCNDCGNTYERKSWKLKTTGKYNYGYGCKGRKNKLMKEKTNCTNDFIMEDELLNTLIEIINKYLVLFNSSNISYKENTSIVFYVEEKNKVELQISRIKNLKIRLYEKYDETLITLDDYKVMNEKYNSELFVLGEKFDEVSNYLLAERKKENKLKESIKKIKKYETVKTLNREILELLVDKIIISHNKTINIIWKFEDFFE